MDQNREEILATFQSITGIEDVAEAIYYLDDCKWDLIPAVQRVLPQDTESQDFQAAIDVDKDLNDFDVVSNVDAQMSASFSPAKGSQHRNIFGSGPSTGTENSSKLTAEMFGEYSNGGSSSNHAGPSRIKSRNITFNVHFQDEFYKIIISDQATIGNLKEKIMEATSVPVCRQALTGWIGAGQSSFDNTTVLNTLSVTRENTLVLNDLTAEGSMDDANDIFTRFNETYTLNIVQQPIGRSIPLKCPGKQTILEVKTNIYFITDIQVRHQEWTGWPANITNQTTLAQSGIGLVHDFVLHSTENNTTAGVESMATTSNRGTSTTSTATSATRANNANVFELDTSDSSVDEFEDASDFNADDDLFSESTVQNRINYLIPDEVDDEKVGSIQFVQNYIKRYGEPHPEFFQGSLEDALTEACLKPAKDRKLLAIYLHHDGSVLTNVFCDQLLKCESIMQTLQHNFILYGWDVTLESNKNMFLSALSVCGSMTATVTVRNMSINQMPSILIIGKTRSTCELLSVIHGNVSKDELLNKLIDIINMYSDQRDVEIREENDRAAREMVKMEQDFAYNESLEADRRKEEVRRQKEHALATERKRLESERQEIEALREANRLDAEKCLPPEPPADAKQVSKIRIRKPNGEFFERRFAASSTLDILLKFIASKGYPIDEFKVISSFPRRDLTTINSSDTLEKLKLYPQETVILEER